MSSLEEKYLNYLEYKNSDNEYKLTENGYELFENNKKSILQSVKDYTTNTLQTYKDIGGKIKYYNDEIGTGILRGGTKLVESVGGLGLATLEKLDLASEGSVQKFGDFFAKEIYPRIGETETLAGGFAEGISQFLTPGLGYYKLFGTLIKAKGVMPFITRALSAEAATVGTAQVPMDPNFVSFVSEMFGIDTTQAESLSKELFNYIATPETEYNADTVFKEKMKAIIGDSALGPLGEGIMLFGKLFKGMKEQPEIVKELNNSINLSGGSAMNPEGPLAKEIEEGTFSYKAELEGPERFDTVMIMDSIEPVIIGTGKNNKVKVEDIINHFDQAPKLDIKNPDDFKLMVDQGVKEVTYQLDQKITGAGWYDKDIKIAMEKLDEINPKFKGNDQIKDMVVFLTAIASPGQNVGMDFKVAAQIADIYLDTGKFPTTNPNSLRNADDVMVKLGKAEIGEEKGWTQRSHLKGQIEFVQKYVDANGLDAFLEFLHTPTTRRALNELRKSYGMKPIAGALDKEIYGADMFGPKVSKFMQSLMGTSDEAVPDIWFTRGFNRKSGNVYTIKKDGVKASADQPRNLAERQIMDNYVNEIRIQLENSIGIKLNNRDTQAVLWYFEQGLYTKLGVKSEPKSYADAATTIIERKANDIEGGFSQGDVNNVESKEIKNFATENEYKSLKKTKPNKEFDEIINGTLPHQDLVVFKPNTPIRVKTAYFKITDDPDGLMSIQENVVGADIYNKYVDINKSEKKLNAFMTYAAKNYNEDDFETIMKKAGIDEDTYEDYMSAYIYNREILE